MRFEGFRCWDERHDLPKTPGVYVITKGNSPEPIYIGLTIQRHGLAGRLRQFDRSARTGRPAHAGGVTFHQKFGRDVASLRVAVRQSDLKMADISTLRVYAQHVERLLIWRHVRRYGRLPVCNSI